MSTIVLHGGAGGGGEAQLEGVRAALLVGVEALRATNDSLRAVCMAVAEMERSGLFNAGRGAVRTRDGMVELDAAVMRGSDRAAGSVAALTLVRHPVWAARAVIDSGDTAFLAGIGADEYAESCSLDVVNDDWFRTTNASSFGTVGAVAVDGHGVCSVATSTGGIAGQRRGRVGDTPIIGAGTYANRHCAVSATGDGEKFMRAVFAHSVATQFEAGLPLDDACRRGLADVTSLNGAGGCIAVTADGEFAIQHTTRVMPAGAATTEGAIHLQLTASDSPA